jgi:hypothetical protein
MVGGVRAISDRRLLALPLAIAALVAIGGGCGSDDSEETVTEQSTVTVGGSPTAPASGTGTGAEATASARALPLKSFGTPSGNIGCQLSTKSARCDIKEHDWTAPPKPAYCDVDWAGGVAVSSGNRRASLICAGDTAFDLEAPVLAYGGRARRGEITCVSRPAGISCTSTSGHGFFLSRQKYRLF